MGSKYSNRVNLCGTKAFTTFEKVPDWPRRENVHSRKNANQQLETNFCEKRENKIIYLTKGKKLNSIAKYAKNLHKTTIL